MGKEGNTKVIAIIALVVAVVGLSVGFAAFSKTLNITFLESSVTPSGTLDIRFLAVDTEKDAELENITKTVTANKINGAISATDATISTDASTISNISVTFGDKGQSVEYDFYIYNASEYDAYLRKVELLNYNGETGNKVCTAINGTDQTMVDAACEDITLTLEIAGSTITSTTEDGFTTALIGSQAEPIPVKLTIAYTNDETLLPNGDFTINFGAIKLSYSSIANQ